MTTFDANTLSLPDDVYPLPSPNMTRVATTSHAPPSRHLNRGRSPVTGQTGESTAELVDGDGHN